VYKKRVQNITPPTRNGMPPTIPANLADALVARNQTQAKIVAAMRLISLGRLPISQCLLASICVLGMSFSSSGFLPTLITAVGGVDSDHRVIVKSSGEQIEVRFHHRDENSVASNSAEASAVNTSDSQDDHVIRFCSFCSTGDLVAWQFHSSAPRDIAGYLAVIEAGSEHPCLRSYAVTSHARPPPGEALLIRCIRSIVLLV
jgi:hypothetical protein